MPEAGRAIIQDQVNIEGRALPRDDQVTFADLMLSWELRSHREALAMAGPILMNRGVPEVIGYLTLCGLPIPQYIAKAAELYRYNQRVFIAPYWEKIFKPDTERKHNKKEVEATFKIMEKTYSALGYELVHLPFANIEERAAFILRHIRNG